MTHESERRTITREQWAEAHVYGEIEFPFTVLPLAPSFTQAEYDRLKGMYEGQKEVIGDLQQMCDDLKAKLDAVPKYISLLKMKCPQCESELIQDVACEQCDKSVISDLELIKELKAKLDDQDPGYDELKALWRLNFDLAQYRLHDNDQLRAEIERLKKWKPACFGVGPNAPCETTDWAHQPKECKECPAHKRNRKRPDDDKEG